MKTEIGQDEGEGGLESVSGRYNSFSTCVWRLQGVEVCIPYSFCRLLLSPPFLFLRLRLLSIYKVQQGKSELRDARRGNLKKKKRFDP